jgi:GUN4-like
MFRNVRSGVYQETKGNQILWVSVSITESFAFNSADNNTAINKPISPNNPPQNNLSVIAAARAIDRTQMYERLEYFLANKQWQKADQQTWEIMRQVSSSGRKLSLDSQEIENFSCQDLTKIDQLWLKYSNNKFGLSVQEKVFQSLGGNNDRNSSEN